MILDMDWILILIGLSGFGCLDVYDFGYDFGYGYELDVYDLGYDFGLVPGARFFVPGKSATGS